MFRLYANAAQTEAIKSASLFLVVVRYFDEDNPRHKKDYWLIPAEEMFLEDCRGKKSKRGK